jgi:hypothetical protein
MATVRAAMIRIDQLWLAAYASPAVDLMLIRIRQN